MNRHGDRTLRKAAIGVALTLVGVGAVLLARSPRAKEKPPVAEVELEDGLVKPVRAPLPRVQTLTQTVPVEASPPPRPPLPATTSSAQTTPEEKAQARLELDRRREQHVVGQFVNDAPAIPASKEMERNLASAFEAQRARGVTVNGIECRERICRVDLTFATVNADIAVLRDLFVKDKAPELASYGQSIAPTREYLPDGKVRTTMYVAREGDFEVID